MSKPQVQIRAWLPDGALPRLVAEFSDLTFSDARQDVSGSTLSEATITYGLPPVERLGEESRLRWIQLISAGVPAELCSPAHRQRITVTNLAGLYGPSIAEHALGLMVILARKLHVALRNQQAARWDRDIAAGMTDLAGRTLAIVGLGNIGRSIARLARAYGMRVVGCRRTDRSLPDIDQVYPRAELHTMLAEADYVAVAAPLTAATTGLLSSAEFAAMKRGAVYINVSRGPIADEAALLAVLQSGHVAAAGLDVFAVEPLAPGHPFWSMPQVVFSPHVSGEVINTSSRPVERFRRNLHAWLAGRPLEGLVDLEQGY